MPIITLPKEVAAKIAAGEVVERPHSVVKELVENSIDAGATEIKIRIEEAGKKRIEVIDNGSGITLEDSITAIKRYATSKIASIEDLDKIQTLGFRGEALASIAAVSRFAIDSRSKNEEVGHSSYIEGGEEVERKQVGRSFGTMVSVEDLFFNVPARLKFLKKDITEKRLINIMVSRYALFYAQIRFTLYFNDRKVFSSNGNGNQREVLTQIYKIDTAKSLLDVGYSDEYINVKGFTSPLNISRSSRKEIFFFINGRLVSDPAISAAITRAYHGLLMVGRFPITNLFITIDPAEIDVNVHPTKAEIRFTNSNRVFGTIHRAIRKTISAFAPYAAVPTRVWQSYTPSNNHEQVELDFRRRIDPQNDGSRVDESISIDRVDPQTIEKVPLLRLIGQLGLTYIAAEGPDGLYLIDQHAAHERILFEKMNFSTGTDALSQLLLEPVVLSLPNYQCEQLETKKKMLFDIGFQFEVFGPGTYKLTAIPQILISSDPSDALLSAITDEEATPAQQIENDIQEKMIARICKRMAVKGGQILSDQEQLQLIRDLEACQNPRTCPHGRPTMIHISVNALERQFGRRGSV